MLGEPVHVLWPCARALEAGENRRSTALEAVDQHQGDGVAVELGARRTIVLHPQTNKWHKKSKSLVELSVGLHQSSVGGTKPANIKKMRYYIIRYSSLYS